MSRVLPPKYYINSVGIDADGLPEYAAAPLVSKQIHVFRDGEPFFLCTVCDAYKMHLHFPPEALAALPSSQWRCYKCLSQQPKFIHPGEPPRLRAICANGVRLYCSGCGLYKPPTQWQRYDVFMQRSRCGQCRSADVVASKVRNGDSFCRFCGGKSKLRVCEWCAVGVPPVTARCLNVPRVPEKLQDVNFAFHVFGTPAKFAPEFNAASDPSAADPSAADPS